MTTVSPTGLERPRPKGIIGCLMGLLFDDPPSETLIRQYGIQDSILFEESLANLSLSYVFVGFALGMAVAVLYVGLGMVDLIAMVVVALISALFACWFDREFRRWSK